MPAEVCAGATAVAAITALSAPATFADDGSAVITRSLDAAAAKEAIAPPLSARELADVYEVERTVRRICDRSFTKVALQFPDDLLEHSASIAAELERRTAERGLPCRCYILADTSYGSCCVDEVAATHVDAEFVVHYGRACVSPSTRLPVLYVFGRKPVIVERAVTAFKALLGEQNANSVKAIVMCDVVYYHCIDDVCSALRNRGYTNVIPTTVRTEWNPQGAACQPKSDEKLSAGSSRTSCGRAFQLPEHDSVEKYAIFYIGGESLTLTNIIMTYNKCQVYSYDPLTDKARQESLNVNRSLMRRYFLVQKAKDADVIGIVVGTLCVASYMKVIDHVKALVASAGKKAYLLVMGKLNVAKMANFMEVDVYVLIACPENSLIDSKEFYRPIVTPFELEIAIGRGRTWTGEYTTDFHRFLPDRERSGAGIFADEHSAAQGNHDHDDDRPHFSLVTGQLKQLHGYRMQSTEPDESGTGDSSVAVLSKETQIARILDSPAVEYLNSRSFKGLERQLGETAAADIKEGRTGIARGYSNEDGTGTQQEWY